MTGFKARLAFVVLLLAFAFLIISCDEQPKTDDWVVNISKTHSGDYVILNLTDIQLGTTAYELDFAKISADITKMVEDVRPDMITFTGDLSYGCSTAVYGICSFIDSFGIPWAPVYGNHDHENSGMSPDTYAKVLGNFSNCVFRDGPEGLSEGKGNYVVNICDDDGIVKSLIFMNSGTKGINDSQVRWYAQCIDTLSESAGATVSSAVFMHIPIYGFTLAAKSAFARSPWSISLEESYTGSSLVWKTGYEDSFGVCHESLGPLHDDGLFDVMQEKHSTDLVVCGHNHANCACIRYEGITLCYGLKTGPGCYFEEGMQGGTVIRIADDSSCSVSHCFF